MGLVEINPNTWAAPRTRPPGMRDDVPYEPMVERARPVRDRATVLAIKAWYGLPIAGWMSQFNDWRRDGKLAPVEGNPGAPILEPNGGWRVAVMGDMGEGSPSQSRVAEQVLRWGPTHVATTGDNVYPLGREVDYEKRFDKQFAELRQGTVWKPALGNHDYYGGDLRPYFRRFTETEGNAYYSWKLGPAEFFVLDSEQRLDTASKQRAWFEGALGASTAAYRVVQLHRPLVSTNENGAGGSGYGSLAPLLAEYGVQLVLTGHEHGYERSKAISGTVHVVTGGGGANALPNPLRMPDTTAARSRRHHHVQLAFDAARMVVTAVDDRGGAFDSFELAPHAPAGAMSARVGAAQLARG